MRTIPLAAVLLGALLLGGCLRLQYDRCDDEPPHPECGDAGADAAPVDAGSTADAGGTADAGSTVDAGSTADAGSTERDAGASDEDAGRPDGGGSGEDAGASEDAATADAA